mmetsp:Transcript_28551/g.39419  ORF Transcript_28551/g.39419 Transcript_28551/m.39419 type:complete len:218 (-) Transcript_28551:435-1088(-)
MNELKNMPRIVSCFAWACSIFKKVLSTFIISSKLVPSGFSATFLSITGIDSVLLNWMESLIMGGFSSSHTALKVCVKPGCFIALLTFCTHNRLSFTSVMNHEGLSSYSESPSMTRTKKVYFTFFPGCFVVGIFPYSIFTSTSCSPSGLSIMLITSHTFLSIALNFPSEKYVRTLSVARLVISTLSSFFSFSFFFFVTLETRNSTWAITGLLTTVWRE